MIYLLKLADLSIAMLDHQGVKVYGMITNLTVDSL